jgi:hypothetical protein
MTSMKLDVYHSVNASCPRCNNYIGNIKHPSDIKAIIHDNIDRDIYEDTIAYLSE